MKMKKEIILALGFFILIFSGLSSALEGSYMYVSLSYGRGWWPWVCVTEKGVKGYGQPANYCSGRECPFEKAALFGDPCNDEAEFLPAAWGLVSRISIPEDLKLVTQDNYVVKDEICIGDSFKFSKAVNKGEWYNDGGHFDTPPIYWVDDVEKLVLKIMSYHEGTITGIEDICKDFPKGDIDNMFNIPIYDTEYHHAQHLTGNFICSIKEKNLNSPRRIESYENEYHQVTTSGNFNFTVNFDVECFYYYFGGRGGGYFNINEISAEADYCDYYILRVPTVIQAGPHATLIDSGTHNVYFNSISDFFRVGTIGINKTIKVVEPANVSVELSTTFDKVNLLSGKETLFKVKVKNSGNTELEIKKVSSNVPYEFVTCDSDKVKPNAETECLLKVTPDPTLSLSISVSYEYKNGGRRRGGISKKDIVDKIFLKPKESIQAYKMNVKGDCENEYYACSSPAKEGKFYAGYECNNKDPYFVPAKERFNLRFDLSSIPEDIEILGAGLYMYVSKVNKPQEVKVYSVSNSWTPKICEPGGDICTQPYCRDCLPIFELGGNLIDKQQISRTGWHMFDVIEIVKGKTQLSFQIQGDEKLWTEMGKTSCTKPNEWDHYDVEFSGAKSANEPFLEIVYFQG